MFLWMVALFLLAGCSSSVSGPTRAHTNQASPLVLDHIWVAVPQAYAGVGVLEELGLHYSGRTTRHIGLGTAGTYFYFDNAYLELLWLDDAETFAQATSTSWPFGTIRFGLAFHQRRLFASRLPFPVRTMRWDWMPPGTAMKIAQREATSAEPVVFVLPPQLAYTAQHTVHPLGMQRLTRVRVVVEGDRPLSPTAQWLSRHTIVTMESGPQSVLELTFDGGVQGRMVDARPTLPLVVRY